jgi:ubiquinone/menaquinone biosynthesis C-methylase UbiE
MAPIRPQERRLVPLFDSWAEHYAALYSDGSPTSHYFNTRLSHICAWLDLRQGSRVLDAGCGPAMTAEPLTGSGAEFFGIDVSQQMIRSGRNRVGNLAACHLAVSRIEELPFPDGFFDAVLCTGVLEYVEDDGVAVRELRRVLKREGNLIVSLLNGVSPYRAVENLELALHGRTRPEKMFTERYCRNLLRECAFEIVDILYHCCPN